MVAKCGPRVIHHWADASRRDRDPWWENETAWHREWKSLFPPECGEVYHNAPNGEVHRADIKTPTGVAIEIQHSAMTDKHVARSEALLSRAKSSCNFNELMSRRNRHYKRPDKITTVCFPFQQMLAFHFLVLRTHRTVQNPKTVQGDTRSRQLRELSIVKLVRTFWAIVRVTDPLAEKVECQREYGIALTALSDLRAADAVIVAVAHDEYRQAGWSLVTKSLRDSRGLVMDIKTIFDRDKVPLVFSYGGCKQTCTPERA
jgi:hypothetical protein